MPLAVQPITPAVAALAADLGVALQPGTTVNAQVLRVLDANLVRIAIGALTLDATTMVPLQQGQRLRLAVGQTSDAITLTPVPGEGGARKTADTLVAIDDIPLAPKSPAETIVGKPGLTLTPQETRAVATAAQAAVTKQSGLSQLFANLTAAMDGGELPRPVAAAAKQLLGLRQTTDSMSADDIRAGLESSGLLLEAATARTSNGAPPDLKSALLILKQALSTWISEGDVVPPANVSVKSPAGEVETSPASQRAQPSAEVADAVESLVGQGRAATMTAAASKNLLAMQLIASATGEAAGPHPDHTPQSTLPPPFRNGLPSPQQIMMATLAPDAAPADIAHQLMSDADGALARQTLLQVASLPDRIDQQALRSDPAQPRWNFEIPFVTPQGTAMAQFEIAHDGGGEEYEASSKRVWKARFSINIEPAGPVHALITYGGEATHVKMWAERPATAAQIRANAGALNASLHQANLNAGDIVVADGAPAQARAPAAGHFLNRAT